jgi:hypothetical protein
VASICDHDPVAGVVRLLTIADLLERADPRELSVAARHEAVLDDGRHMVLLDDRGWTEGLRGAGEDADIWEGVSERHIAETARVVVGPDEPFGGRTQREMEESHWAWLAGKLAADGVSVEPAELGRLPHDVVLGDRLRARLGGTGLIGPA